MIINSGHGVRKESKLPIAMDFLNGINKCGTEEKCRKLYAFSFFVHLQSNGIYLLGLLILPQETSSADEAATVDNLQVTRLTP